MGRVDDEIDPLVAEVYREPVRPAEASGADRDGHRSRPPRAAGERVRRLDSGIARECTGELDRLAGPTEKEQPLRHASGRRRGRRDRR